MNNTKQNGEPKLDVGKLISFRVRYILIDFVGRPTVSQWMYDAFIDDAMYCTELSCKQCHRYCKAFLITQDTNVIFLKTGKHLKILFPRKIPSQMG